jgi:hypothetical protein
MSRAGQKTRNNKSKARAITPGRVPVIVPHGGAEAGRDYESAFDMVRHDGKVHELWRRGPVNPRIGRAT